MCFNLLMAVNRLSRIALQKKGGNFTVHKQSAWHHEKHCESFCWIGWSAISFDISPSLLLKLLKVPFYLEKKNNNPLRAPFEVLWVSILPSKWELQSWRCCVWSAAVWWYAQPWWFSTIMRLRAAVWWRPRWNALNSAWMLWCSLPAANWLWLDPQLTGSVRCRPPSRYIQRLRCFEMDSGQSICLLYIS